MIEDFPDLSNEQRAMLLVRELWFKRGFMEVDLPPISYRRPTLDRCHQVDPLNNVGRFCDIGADSLDQELFDALGWGRRGRTWQIIGYCGPDDEGTARYSVVHVDDPTSYGMAARLTSLINLYP